MYATTYTVKTANYTDALGYCPQAPNCYPSVTPKCGVTRIREAYGPGVFCHNFHVSLTPVVNGTCVGYALSTEAPGPGPCTSQ